MFIEFVFFACLHWIYSMYEKLKKKKDRAWVRCHAPTEHTQINDKSRAATIIAYICI